MAAVAAALVDRLLLGVRDVDSTGFDFSLGLAFSTEAAAVISSSGLFSSSSLSITLLLLESTIRFLIYKKT